MFRLAAYAMFWVIVATPATAQSVSERLGINAFLGISPSTQDFVNEVALNEMLEIELSKLAENSGDSNTKEFASKMLQEHRETSAHLKGLVRSGQVRVSLPTTLDRARQAKVNKLKSLNGADFDQEFEQMQINIHYDTISLFERYGSGGSHPDLKVFAFKHLAHLREHWRLARDLNKK